MTIQRQSNTGESKDWMVRLDREITANKALRHLDANIELEPFFRDLLNSIFSWSLTDANWSQQKNQDAFDLCDKSARIAVQVTSTMTPAKIKSTLESFLEKYRDDYDRLIFVYPFLSKSGSRKDYISEAEGFDFDPKRDRMDLNDLLREIQNLEIDPQRSVLTLLRKELKPLGTALQLGVDANVEAIIHIIQHISSGLPDEKPEKRPNAEVKLRRFAEHAKYLKRQYTSYVECYATIKEARSAIGYDAVRAIRCAAWLRERSLTMLETHKGDAKIAFDALVDYFKELLHNSGGDCEDSAIRYFLADELLSCNVFPNPEIL